MVECYCFVSDLTVKRHHILWHCSSAGIATTLCANVNVCFLAVGFTSFGIIAWCLIVNKVVDYRLIIEQPFRMRLYFCMFAALRVCARAGYGALARPRASAH